MSLEIFFLKSFLSYWASAILGLIIVVRSDSCKRRCFKDVVLIELEGQE